MSDLKLDEKVTTNELAVGTFDQLSIPEGLVISADSVFPLESGFSYRFPSLRIEIGGKLLIQGVNKLWTMIRVDGDFVCDGQIICTHHPIARTNSETNVETTAPDGQKLSHIFKYTAGGRGGNGATYVSAPGGIGAFGSVGAAGGGGSGASADGVRNGAGTPGNPANGATGGPSQADRRYYGGAGGNGATISSIGDGGLLYMSVGGAINGEGLIKLSGAAGVSGTNGDANPMGGGGGGGGPGHAGGALFLKAVGVIRPPKIDVSGGDGGLSGNGGVGTVVWGNSPGIRRDGSPGQAGAAGNDGRVVLDAPW